MMAEDNLVTLHVAESEPENGVSFHPLFSEEDGDIILGASDRTLFRIHSFVLKKTSGWFRSLFSMPQRNSEAMHEVIYLIEEADILEKLLRMICGLPILPPESYDDVDALLFAAEKYEMPGPISLIRLLVMTPPLLDQPLRLYVVASRYKWESEAKLASTQTLVLNIHAPEYRSILRRAGTDAVLDLIQLHRDRREAIRHRLDQHPFVGGSGSAGSVVVCPRCRRQIGHHTWRELKYKVILEMDVRPLGDTVLNYGLSEWPEAKACWEAKCPNPDCMCVLYDKLETLRLIRECIDGLPGAV